jgi:hypothetical protein
VPLLPIDLQTLFTQMNQVAKDQTVQKDSVPHAQAAAGSQIVKQVGVRDARVNETQRQEEGAEQVRRRGRREAQGKRQPPEKGKGKKTAEQQQKKDVFRDPALGSHIDVTG